MDAISYTTARTNLAQTMEQVCNDHAPVIITRKKGAPVVLISLEDYRALEETLYLLSTPCKCMAVIGIDCRAGNWQERYTITD